MYEYHTSKSRLAKYITSKEVVEKAKTLYMHHDQEYMRYEIAKSLTSAHNKSVVSGNPQKPKSSSLSSLKVLKKIEKLG